MDQGPHTVLHINVHYLQGTAYKSHESIGDRDSSLVCKGCSLGIHRPGMVQSYKGGTQSQNGRGCICNNVQRCAQCGLHKKMRLMGHIHYVKEGK